MDNLIRSNIRQRPIRTLVSVAGVALGVTLVMLFTGLTRGMSNDMQRVSPVKSMTRVTPKATPATLQVCELDAECTTNECP